MLNSTSHSTPIEVLGQNLAQCHRCPRRQAKCAGACACMEDGRDIVEHAKAGDCALGRHIAAPPSGLGDVVASLAKRVGADRAAAVFHRLTGRDCGCRKRREKLNRLVPFRTEPMDR
ncbi:MAG TPA: hypothetical protein VG326_08570 [Tepidisphaeraceae bacterium]|nr:hypothetical protein [Tepidisphaeraceae bacterium]